jgi:hypothetical protein
VLQYVRYPVGSGCLQDIGVRKGNRPSEMEIAGMWMSPGRGGDENTRAALRVCAGVDAPKTWRFYWL